MPRLHLINARMSQRSFHRHRRIPWFATWLLGHALCCFAQSDPDATRLRLLGAGTVVAVGSTKWDGGAPPADPRLLDQLALLQRGRKVLLLASSHPGDEEKLLKAWRDLRQSVGPLFLLIVPRHPDRARSVLAMARNNQLSAGIWSDLAGMADPRSHGNLDAVVVDQLGAMGSWIAAADLVVMGGSFALEGRLVGGHNPLEPIRAGKRVVSGPDMANFAGLSEELVAAGWLHRFSSEEAIWTGVAPLLKNPPPLPPPLHLDGPSSRIARRVVRELSIAAKLVQLDAR